MNFPVCVAIALMVLALGGGVQSIRCPGQDWYYRNATKNCYYVYGNTPTSGGSGEAGPAGTTLLSFDQSVLACKMQGGKLVTIEDANEFEWLKAKLAPSRWYWVGLTYENLTWQWYDGESYRAYRQVDTPNLVLSDPPNTLSEAERREMRTSLLYSSTSNKFEPKQERKYIMNGYICKGDWGSHPWCKTEDGWTYHDGRCYRYFPESEPFYWAQYSCFSEGGYIATINSQSEDDRMKTWLRDTMRVERGWLGITIYNKTAAHTVDNIVWEDGTSILATGVNNWVSKNLSAYITGLPNNQEYCGEMFSKPAQYVYEVDSYWDYGWGPVWQDAVHDWSLRNNCHEAKPFACETPLSICPHGWHQIDEMCYQVNWGEDRLRNWTAARKDCTDVNAELLVIDNERTQYFIDTLMSDIWYSTSYFEHFYWMGLKSSTGGAFTWVDGKPLNYSSWSDHGTPTTVPGQDRCVFIDGNESWGNHGDWNVTLCTQQFGYICQAHHTAAIKPPDDVYPAHSCDPPYVKYHEGCYLVVPEQKQRIEAQQHCAQTQGGVLAIINTFGENSWLQDRVTKDSWIGIQITGDNGASSYDRFTYTYSDGREVGAGAFKRFYDTVTYNSDHAFDKYCVAMAGENSQYDTSGFGSKAPRGYWYHLPCTEKREFVCYHPGTPYIQPIDENGNDPRCGAGWFRNGDDCYRTHEDAVPWRLAKQTCQGMDTTGDLLYITSREEEIFISRYIEDNLSDFWGDFIESYWIDLYKGSQTPWHWPYRDSPNRWHIPLTILNWYWGEPTAASDRPACAYIQNDWFDAQWFSDSCEHSHPYICKKTLPKINPTVSPPPTARPGMQLGCPQHWFQVDNRCLRFNLTKTDWVSARAICRQHNSGDLTSIQNEMEFQGIKNFAAGSWIGLNSIAYKDHPRVFAWSDGTPMTFTPWDVESASSNGTGITDVNCGAATSNGFAMYSCNEKKSFICEMPFQSINISDVTTIEIPHDRGCLKWGRNFHGSCYYFGQDVLSNSDTRMPYSFNDARTFCANKFSADLVIISDLGEQEFLNAWIAASQQEYWIGLKESSEPWNAFKKWVDGTSVTHANWAVNQPISPPADTGCVSVHGRYKGEDELPGDWFVDKCGELKFALCEGVSTFHPPHPTRPPAVSTPSPTGCPAGWRTMDQFSNCYKSYVGRSSGHVRKVSWQSAEDFCRRFNYGHLASISSQEEQDFIDRTVNIGLDGGYPEASAQFWTGLRQDPFAQNRWQWSDGAPFLFSWFHPTENHENGESSNCVAMEYMSPGRWISQSCHQAHSWTCEIPKGTYYEGQIIELFPSAIETNATCGNSTSEGEWYYEPETRECLFWSHKEDSWQNAQHTCEQLGANLATVTNHSQQFITLKSSQFASSPRPFWIGLYQTDFVGRVFEWVDGHVSLYRNWELGNPDPHGTERCVVHNSKSGRWQDHNCGRSFQYICAKSMRVRPSVPPTHLPSIGNCAAGWVTFHDQCYYISGHENKTWDEAHRLCNQELTVDQGLPRGELASIHHSLENDFLITQMRGRHHYNFWIGLHENGDNVWVWSDQSRLSYNNWHASEPLPTSQTDCIEFGSGFNRAGTWSASRCSEKRGYICKAPKNPTSTPAPPPPSPCPAGYTQSGEHACFIVQKLDAGQTSWDQAQLKCRSLGDRTGEIATVENHFESAQLRILLNEMIHINQDEVHQHRNGSAWIGMQEHAGNFVWHNSCPVIYSNFFDLFSRPSGMDSCVRMDQHGKWFSATCGDPVAAEYVACEKRTRACEHFNQTSENWYCPVDFPAECPDICYRVQVGTTHHGRPERYTFERAREECRRLRGGNLASIRSEVDQKCLEKYIQHATHGMWIGLYEARDPASQQFVWKWEDEGHGYLPGSAYLNWAEGKPELSTDLYEYWRKGCVEMRPDGKWTNIECDSWGGGSGYICEARKEYKEVTRRTTLLPPPFASTPVGEKDPGDGYTAGQTAGIVIGVLIAVAVVAAIGYVVMTGKTTAVVDSVRGAGSRMKQAATTRISTAGFGNSNYEQQNDKRPVIEDPEYHAGASDSYT